MFLLRDEIINRMNLLMEVMTNEDLETLHNNSFDNWQVKYKDNDEFEQISVNTEKETEID